MGAIVKYDEYIERLKNKFGNKYDYSRVDKENFRYSGTKYEYKCNIHNIWFTKTCKSMCRDKNCCPICRKEAWDKQNEITLAKAYKSKKKKKFYKLDEFLKIVNDKFPNFTVNLNTIKYNFGNFSNGNHICLGGKIECLCDKHGIFITTPGALISNKFPCKKCYNEYVSQLFKDRCENIRLEKLKSFKENATLIHGNKYDYSKININDPNNKQEIICPIHGSFFQHPILHLRGEGCPICAKGAFANSTSPNEQRLLSLLKEKFNDLVFENGYRNKMIFGRQNLDIYNDKYKFAIEYQGSQHFEENKYLTDDDRHSLKHRQELDLRKYNLCKENNIKLFYFTFNKKFENIEYLDKVYTKLEELYYDIENYIKSKGK